MEKGNNMDVMMDFLYEYLNKWKYEYNTNVFMFIWK